MSQRYMPSWHIPTLFTYLISYSTQATQHVRQKYLSDIQNNQVSHILVSSLLLAGYKFVDSYIQNNIYGYIVSLVLNKLSTMRVSNNPPLVLSKWRNWGQLYGPHISLLVTCANLPYRWQMLSHSFQKSNHLVVQASWCMICLASLPIARPGIFRMYI